MTFHLIFMVKDFNVTVPKVGMLTFKLDVDCKTNLSK